MSTTSESTITIVGAGPVGLYLAYLLGIDGVTVHVYDQEPKAIESPRAIVSNKSSLTVSYLAPTLNDFRRSGIYEHVLKAGAVNKTGQQWRRREDGSVLASMPPPPGGEVVALTMGQHELAAVILRQLEKLSSVEVHFSTKMSRFEETADGVRCWVEEEGQNEREHLSKFLIGADGGRSTVRKQLDIPFEGHTWEDFRMVAVNVDYDVEKYNGWGAANFIVDPEHWGVVVYSGKGTIWRVASGERLVKGKEDDWDEELETRKLYERLKLLFKGPTETAKVLAMSPYRIHQRCAATFAKGRIALAGDAAHLNNPVGGLGLTTGFLDASLLHRKLSDILADKVSYTKALAEYSDERRRVFLEVTNPVSIANRGRLIGATEEARKERDEYFAALNRFDPEFFKKFMMSEAALSSQ
ncbi:FAD-binding monooxygenase [Ilyonectria sp. MPI-CAGE-AT-0026]|nr:FAD-binding monooxygenase [Ilyonectria sp. MPI-CAGE-AT-0026]